MDLLDWRSMSETQQELALAAIAAERKNLIEAIRFAQSPEVAETRQRELTQLDELSARIRDLSGPPTDASH